MCGAATLCRLRLLHHLGYIDESEEKRGREDQLLIGHIINIASNGERERERERRREREREGQRVVDVSQKTCNGLSKMPSPLSRQ